MNSKTSILLFTLAAAVSGLSLRAFSQVAQPQKRATDISDGFVRDHEYAVGLYGTMKSDGTLHVSISNFPGADPSVCKHVAKPATAEIWLDGQLLRTLGPTLSGSLATTILPAEYAPLLGGRSHQVSVLVRDAGGIVIFDQVADGLTIY